MQAELRSSRSSGWLGPGELARRLSISVKALRVYERAGLVAPGRREGGWRTYGPKDIARLHEVLALKSLGLSLAEVKQVLEAPTSSLKHTLGIQQRHLAAQIGAAQRRLAAVNAARRRLEEEGSLDVEQLLALTSETAATPPISADQVEAIVHGLAKDHEAQAELERFDRRLKALLDEAGVRHSDFERSLSQLVADASVVSQNVDPSSEQSRQLADRWNALVARLDTGQARDLESLGPGVAAFASTLIADPNLAAALAFLRQAVAAHRPSVAPSAKP